MIIASMSLSGILHGLGFILPAPDASPISGPNALIASANTAGTDSALTLEAVYRAVDILQTAAVQVSIDQYRGNEKVEPAARIVKRPDPRVSLRAFMRETVACLALTGNAYWRIFRDDKDVPQIARLLPVEQVTVSENANGDRVYTYGNATYTSAEIKHLKKFDVPGELYGLGPIQAARRMLQGAIANEKTATSWQTAGGVPTGVLKTDRTLPDEKLKGIKTAWNDSASQANGVVVLSNGFDYSPILKPSDVQFLESRGYDAVAISRLFGIPTHLMNVGTEGNSMTYQNLQDANTSFATWTLMSYFASIEDTLSELLPNGNKARFNLDAFIRTDIKRRFETYQIGITTGIYTAEQVRAIEGIQ